MYDAVVIGGGIVGSATAYHLARRGGETLLVDREDDGRATDAGAGILSPATSSRTASDPWFEFGVDAVAYYPELVDRLEAEQDGPTGYAQCGMLSAAVDEDEVEPFERAAERTESRQRRLDDAGLGAIETLSPAAARDRFPPLASVRAARYYADAARVDGRTMTRALRRAGRAHGLAIERANADRVRIEDGAIEGVVVDGTRIETDAVVIAGGAWSSEFGDQLGVEIPVEPERGQIVHLDAGDPGTADWPIVSAFRGHYAVPWPDGRVAVGATRERGAGFEPHATAAGVREVLDEALRVAPGLADAELAEVRVGLRPTAADRLPVVGPVPGVEGAYLATGHGATGLQLGPYTGAVVAATIDDEEPEPNLAPFSPGRFS